MLLMSSTTTSMYCFVGVPFRAERVRYCKKSLKHQAKREHQATSQIENGAVGHRSVSLALESQGGTANMALFIRRRIRQGTATASGQILARSMGCEFSQKRVSQFRAPFPTPPQRISAIGCPNITYTLHSARCRAKRVRLLPPNADGRRTLGRRIRRADVSHSGTRDSDVHHRDTVSARREGGNDTILEEPGE